MKLRVLYPIVALLSALVLSSCQNTNITDLIDFSTLNGEKLEQWQKDVKLKFAREAWLLDSLDRAAEVVTVAKGTTVKVLGFRYDIGSTKRAPQFFQDNYAPREYRLYLVDLPGKGRAFMEVPEMAIGIYGTADGGSSGADSLAVTDVKDQKGSLKFLYKTTAGGDWTERPGIKYAPTQDVPLYFPHRYHMPFAKFVGVANVEKPKFWQRLLRILGGPIDFFTKYTLSYFLYRDGAFYSYHPLIVTSPFWSQVFQAILSYILLLLIFMGPLPWLSSRSVMYIRPLSNTAAKILATMLSFIYFLIILAFMGVTGVVGWLGWLAMYFLAFGADVSDEIDWNRCPYCHRVGLGYTDSSTGSWSSSSRGYDQVEEKSVSYSEHTENRGTYTEKVHTTTHHMGVKHYTDTIRRRTHTNRLYCKHCHQPITLRWEEEDTQTTSYWK